MSLMLTPLIVTLALSYFALRYGRRWFRRGSLLVIALNTVTVFKLAVDLYQNHNMYPCINFLICLSVNTACGILLTMYLTRWFFRGSSSALITYCILNSVRSYVLLCGFALCFDSTPFSHWEDDALTLDIWLSLYLVISVTCYVFLDVTRRPRPLPKCVTVLTAAVILYYYFNPITFANDNIHVWLFPAVVYGFTINCLKLHDLFAPYPATYFLRAFAYNVMICFGLPYR
ncbi:protein E29 [Proboscivirus elephantidbeta4]|uniref:Protein E29 n=1 Tax=Elephant endotheliotropic herpesvirus 4 TaxID=548914 RepID=A0A0S1TQS4_9BETA|nr:protein E29 [Elephant endotheliotropic herpesvirus 4]ALM25964.1 protein E29 [Elephant endotheliotropic herpesvirus 4]